MDPPRLSGGRWETLRGWGGGLAAPWNAQEGLECHSHVGSALFTTPVRSAPGRFYERLLSLGAEEFCLFYRSAPLPSPPFGAASPSKRGGVSLLGFPKTLIVLPGLGFTCGLCFV